MNFEDSLFEFLGGKTLEIKNEDLPILIVPSAAPCKQRNIPNNTREFAQGTAAMDSAEIITASDIMRSVIV